ncbi:MAG: NAD(P)H-hydrate dehydratase [Chloroflexi bacterium]|nr:NAD(P)H-hydrate dehydratase [Chloroflexota bacterium]
MAAPVISVSQMRQWEQATWAAGQTEQSVISRVGRIVAERALDLTKPGDVILILAGKGHNGDDARFARPHLAARDARLLNVSDPAADLAELRRQLASSPALAIDGLFGLGLNRELSADWIIFINEVNHAAIPVLAVDVPSGLNAETGQPEGAALQADVTLTLGAPKRGLLEPSAYPYVGRLEVAAEIGLVPCPLQSDLQWTLADDFQNYPPRRRAEGHKGTYGHLTIIAGSLGYHGAAVLAARGALQARPGLVTLFTSEAVYGPVAAQLQAAMVHPWQPGKSLPETCRAVLFGPGLAAGDLPPDLKGELGHFWQELPWPVIADASSLDWLPASSRRIGALRLITPHPGEAARLLQTTAADVQKNRPAAVRALSKRFGGCWVALKGHQTIVGRSSGDLFVNSSGNPFLAQGGSGDILAGYLGGLLAQPPLQSDPLRAIRFGVWQHGATADRLSAARRHWTIEDLAAALADPVR